MRERLLAYLKNRHYVELLVLVFLVFLLFFILVFTPFRIHEWVVQFRVPLMWGLTGGLVLIIWVLLVEMDKLKKQVLRLSEQEMIEQKEQVERFNFYDEKGDLKLSVKSQMLYYLEGADNYVQIHYSSGERMEKMLIRNTLKNIEWRFRDQSLVRCHRSYIVNLKQVKLVKRMDGEVFLDFGDERLENIPVSKGYGDKLMELLDS